MKADIKLPPIFEGNGPISAEDWARRRLEITDILREQIYGYSPEAPEEIRSEIISEAPAAANKAIERTVKISFDTPGGEFSFPINLTVPKNGIRNPLFILLNFRPDVPDKYYPQEEIVDRGYACARIYYKDVTSDDGDMENGIAGMYGAKDRADNAWGKISMWAFAASRVMDYVLTLDEIDKERIFVIGHSRLGKTALWTAAQDERFAMGISNDSGCSGASLSRMNRFDRNAENNSIIYERFPYWFCKNYAKYSNNEDDMPFDQHFLVAAIAPRAVAVGSAVEDLWACPEGEFESAREAGKIFERLGLDGLSYPHDGEMPKPYTHICDGMVSYHIRNGSHFLSRTDWLAYMDFADKRFGK